MISAKSQRFTLKGHVDVERRIQRDQRHVARSVCKALPTAQFRALLLGGGYGRGEGGYRVTDDGYAPYNDYDYFVVYDGTARECRAAGRTLRRLGHLLERDIGIEVDFAILRWADLPRMEYSLMNTELQLGYCTVAGDPDALNKMPQMTLEKLPLSEFSRLMLNRGSLLLMNQRMLDSGGVVGETEREQFSRYLDKAVLACADARLAAAGRYHLSYLQKRERLAALRWSGGESFVNAYDRALESRFGPKAILVDAGQEENAQKVAIAYWLEALAELEAARLGSLPEWSEYATFRIGKGQSRRGVMGFSRNVFVTMREFGLSEFFRNAGWAFRYPRERLISVLPGLLDPCIGISTDQLADALSRPAMRDRASLTRIFLDYWSRYA